MEQITSNRITLRGTVVEAPTFSHDVYGEKFYRLMLEVVRLSGQKDVLPVIVSERLLSGKNVAVGSRYQVEGQLRTYNLISDNKSRLHLQTFARDFNESDEEEDVNVIVLDGYICKTPIYRVTPFSREITDVLIAVNRAYNKSDYIPSICWGRNARFCQQLKIGDTIKVEGRLQSREYQKKLDDETVVNKIAYEVSVSKLHVDKEIIKEETQEDEETE